MINNLAVAVVGATGLVGEAVINLLQERRVPVTKLFPLTRAESAGGTVEFNNQSIKTLAVEKFDFAKANIAIFCVPADVSRLYVPRAMQQGCTVIDHSSAFRQDPAAHLILPGVNSNKLEELKLPALIACPGSASIQLVLILNALRELGTINKVSVTVSMPVSAIGRTGIEELSSQTIALLNLKPVKTDHFPAQIAFNLLPDQAGSKSKFLSITEQEIITETKYILDDPDIKLNPMVMYAPVFFGCAMTLLIEFKEKYTISEVKRVLSGQSLFELTEGAGEIASPVSCASTDDRICIGRLIEYPDLPETLGIWTVADPVRTGIVHSSVQMTEILVKGYL